MIVFKEKNPNKKNRKKGLMKFNTVNNFFLNDKCSRVYF